MGDRLKKIADEQDPGAFCSVALTFWPKVKTMLMRQGADRETAEEIARETMLAIWCNARRFPVDRGGVSSWVFTIARNLCIDRVKQQAGWQHFYEEELENTVRPQARDEGPRLGDHHRSRIDPALGALPPEQLQVVQLAFIDGLSQCQIAQRLDLPLGTVKSRMRLAFEKLRGVVESGS